jgi:hypothetical protein
LAVFVCAVLLAINQLAFAEFTPGRIDHHNIQITLVMIAMTCAMAVERRSNWALLAGASTGLALAVGIEGLPFHVVIGASYGLLAALGRDDPRTTRNYAAALLATTLACYLLQTPPWRWTLAFCDAIGANFVSGVAIAACGLLVMTIAPMRNSKHARMTILALTAIAGAGAYLAFDPRCIRGVFAAVDPRIVPFWFSSVYELQPLSVMMTHYWNFGIALILMSAMMLASAVFLLAREWPRPKPATGLAAAAILTAVATGFFAFRMENYVQWLGFPALAAAFSIFAARLWKGLMVPTAAFAALLSPVGAVAFALQGYTTITGTPGDPASPPGSFSESSKAAEICHATTAFRPLAALKPGLVLADIYMGPFILAHTPHTALTAPYHRMTWGILAAHDAVSAPATLAEAKFRALKIDYLVECPSDNVHRAPGSIEADLARGQVPDWLEKLSARDDTLQIYRVQKAP